MAIRWIMSVGISGALLACSPALDWRELAVAETGLVASFPCKPQRVVQQELGLFQCEAGGLRFVLAWQRWAEPNQLRLHLAQAAAETTRRTGFPVQVVVGAQLPKGAVAWPGSGRYRLGSDGRAGQMLLWARGLTSYRALVTGSGSDEAAVHFFDGMRSAN
ncbi:MAG: hypothetical protein ACK4F7_00715 [Inhella sp.]